MTEKEMLEKAEDLLFDYLREHSAIVSSGSMESASPSARRSRGSIHDL